MCVTNKLEEGKIGLIKTGDQKGMSGVEFWVERRCKMWGVVLILQFSCEGRGKRGF